MADGDLALGRILALSLHPSAADERLGSQKRNAPELFTVKGGRVGPTLPPLGGGVAVFKVPTVSKMLVGFANTICALPVGKYVVDVTHIW